MVFIGAAVAWRSRPFSAALSLFDVVNVVETLIDIIWNLGAVFHWVHLVVDLYLAFDAVANVFDAWVAEFRFFGILEHFVESTWSQIFVNTTFASDAALIDGALRDLWMGRLDKMFGELAFLTWAFTLMRRASVSTSNFRCFNLTAWAANRVDVGTF